MEHQLLYHKKNLIVRENNDEGVKSMDEELEKTGMFNAVSKDHDDYVSVRERVEQVEDRMDYLVFSDEKKKKLDDMINQIKDCDDEDEQEKTFEQLIDLMEEE